jgi:hypothetical protein
VWTIYLLLQCRYAEALSVDGGIASASGGSDRGDAATTSAGDGRATSEKSG